jgi:hypothetical protein
MQKKLSSITPLLGAAADEGGKAVYTGDRVPRYDRRVAGGAVRRVSRRAPGTAAPGAVPSGALKEQ